MASIKFLLRSKKNPAPIYIRLSAGRGTTPKVRTGLHCDPKQWSESTGMPKQTTASNKKLAQTLLKMKARIFENLNEAQSEGISIDSTWLQYQVDLIQGKVNESGQSEFLVDAIDTLLDTCHLRPNSKGGIGLGKSSYNAYRSLKSKIIAFQGRKRLKVKDVNKKLAQDFLQFMIDEKGYSESYATKSLANLKTVCHDAKKNGVEVSTQLDSIKSIHIKNEFIIYLTPEEIERIKNAEIEQPHLINARKWLILGCAIGQRAGDLLNLTSKNFVYIQGFNMIELTQEKGNKQVRIPVLEDTMNVIKSGLPHKISIQRFNDYIKEVCRIAGIDSMTKGKLYDPATKRKKVGVYPKYKLITSHTCRRSFATNHFNEMPTSIIRILTGHATEQMLLNYIGNSSLDITQLILEYMTKSNSKLNKQPQLEIVHSKKSV
ncbi:hypothetical protein BTO09_03595 [Gilvibacter sp. SZ-19]|uniref:tyrosine-type recombinase/integrase n=1 Tax=Gilvibacter sp. SZ-19 TaxID=754429 RepID=UPI000B3D34CE|nr:tyrosine-type recombinase/integrase [Gilvibacter sp. SZ-19]ARV11477.1 hypothetical protein BTO09_03595 [Gilvibacter sp. SZ-19]